jgi:hypothetical protein
LSHEAVQSVLERTLTDEAFRSRLFTRPEEALAGYELTEEEFSALTSLSIDPGEGDSTSLDERRSKAPLWTLGL